MVYCDIVAFTLFIYILCTTDPFDKACSLGRDCCPFGWLAYHYVLHGDVSSSQRDNRFVDGQRAGILFGGDCTNCDSGYRFF